MDFRLVQSMAKGQIKPKAVWRVVDSPKKLTNKFVLFAFLLFTENKIKLFVCFLGESTARQSCFQFYLTFIGLVGAAAHQGKRNQ